MKKLIITAVILTITISATPLHAKLNNRLAAARYSPVTVFLESDSTLSQWFKQYVDTTSGRQSFQDFIKKLATSEVLSERSKRIRMNQNQLYAPIVSLSEIDWRNLGELDEQQLSDIRINMLELDIALSAIEATIPKSAYEEFRREVIRGAEPLTEVAKLPMSAVEAMTFTLMDRKVSNRVNNPTIKKPPQESPAQITRPSGFQSGFKLW